MGNAKSSEFFSTEHGTRKSGERVAGEVTAAPKKR
jgi:hypothetical protein